MEPPGTIAGKPDAAGAEPARGEAVTASSALGAATYEVLRQRLRVLGGALRERLQRLDGRRREVFGTAEYKLLRSERITTEHNCVPRDMVQLGKGRFLFGFNVQFGLKKEVGLGDVFAIYGLDEATGGFKEQALDPLQDRQFIVDFKRLYNVYERASFAKFSLIDGRLFMVFQVGAGLGDIAVFKWTAVSGQLRYVDGRSETEFKKVGFPPEHEFKWLTPDRESFRYGDFPHVSIKDRVFVECIGGDLTIKVEDNTRRGEGIYSEPVEDKHQKVDDAEIAYALLGHLILLRIRPYKETVVRVLIFNEKTQSVVRADGVGQSCAILPGDQGVIFPDGYYLATGDLKLFESRERGMVLERVIHAPGGEDSLYVFFNRAEGVYVLLPYRIIERRVEERITCHGFSLFPDGKLLLFRSEQAPQRHHQVQLRETPFHVAGEEPQGDRSAFLFQVGNKAVVSCLAECNGLLSLVERENPYGQMYSDLVRRCEAVVDAHPWLAREDGQGIQESVRELGQAAGRAVEEFEKVRRLQREAVSRLGDAQKAVEVQLQAIRRASFRALDDYVKHLAELRQSRGTLITLKEVRFMDLPAVEAVEQRVVACTAELARGCVGFLLKPESLDPYRKRAGEQLAAVERAGKVAECRQLERDVAAGGAELELLIEIVNGLQIGDATEATRIIDGITGVYATLNQVKALLRKRVEQLVVAEGAAQFAAQMKLLGQSAANYLDLCSTPAKCDEYLNRISVHLEEIEGAFAGFEDYAVQLAEKRADLHEAFEQRRLALVEQRNKKASGLFVAAERVLKVIQNRLSGFGSLEQINTYMASDPMIAKVRDLVGQLVEMEDTVKADDLEGRLKSVQQEAVRQLKDRQELFGGGENVIQLGRHRFNVNTQALDLTLVEREGVPHLHLTGTKFFEAVTDPGFLGLKDVWSQEVVSENPQVYRGEFLASQLLKEAEKPEAMARLVTMGADQRLGWIQEFMAGRYQEGYAKGVHDQDALRIFDALFEAHVGLKLARYHPSARACALVYWQRFCPEPTRQLWTAKIKGFSGRNRVFPAEALQPVYVGELERLLAGFCSGEGLFPVDRARAAAEYLFLEVVSGDTFVASEVALEAAAGFRRHLASKGSEPAFMQARSELSGHPASEFELVRDWVRGFVGMQPAAAQYADEISAVLYCEGSVRLSPVTSGGPVAIAGLAGMHPVIGPSGYTFEYVSFRERLGGFEREVVPRFLEYHRRKQELVERERRRLRLEEFKPRVLSSFVRNQLIDKVYLPLVGDNLAKQIGAAGDQKRTDLMGMLLLISPPGYGKTTLLEYVASRLGIVFIKINGPALGHGVVSLDPEEAPNAAARAEIQRLNLALEMGDNVMICVDDIQHCNPEFLQKFISLCDGQRKMEGVWAGSPRTYDLRGRKVVVVMAGNPYTESGTRFKLPDMLANRADTYNLGDILAGSAEWFKASYIENSVTSNPVLAPVAVRSQSDIRRFIALAERGAAEPGENGFEAAYSAQELEEIVSVVRKLVAVRDVVLKVNQEYIRSAAQADEFRTEPPFRLQGSYRNMNRLAEKVVPIMNDSEVQRLVVSYYEAESQTLTSGAESSLLKFKELIGALSPAEAARWEDIKKVFRRNQVSRGADAGDPVGRVTAQLSSLQQGLEGIQQALEAGVKRAPATAGVDLSPIREGFELLRETLGRLTDALPKGREGEAELVQVGTRLSDGLQALREEMGAVLRGLVPTARLDGGRVESLSHELEMIHSTMATLKDLAAQQRDHLRASQELLSARAKQGTVEIELTQEMLSNERAFLERFHQVLADAQRNPGPADTEGGARPTAP